MLIIKCLFTKIVVIYPHQVANIVKGPEWTPGQFSGLAIAIVFALLQDFIREIIPIHFYLFLYQ